jgi:DMSO/TMAO reductase YedYZ molybdopterin-dependent catalytic subunit
MRILESSAATLVGLLLHYAVFYAFGAPLLTDAVAEWIMARTPPKYALIILDGLGAWAKPWAMTGGLATLGFGVWLAAIMRRWWLQLATGAAAAVAMAWLFEYRSAAGAASFWIPALALLAAVTHRVDFSPKRRWALGAVMGAGTVAVAVESFLRDRVLASKAIESVDLYPFAPPAERMQFGVGLVRKAVTSVGEFYGMSKNTVDPMIDPGTWRLKITVDGKLIRAWTYQELLALPRVSGYVTLRCISNTLTSNLMGTAHWSGVRLAQLADRASLPAGIVEAAVIGVDGHGDSLDLDYAFSPEMMLALGMNGKTLNRTHGFPLRLLVPRYYGFKNVKWIGEIAFVSKPYFGTWPKMGYTKQPLIHTASHIDRIQREGDGFRLGGVSFAGVRGVREVQVRADQGAWVQAQLEPPLSPHTLTRWVAHIPSAPGAQKLQARALDGTGKWQEDQESPIFPDGVKGPTFRRVPS